MDREPFHLRCLAAVCGCAPGRACLCPVLTAFARHCAREGALPPQRTQTLCRECVQLASPTPGPPLPALFRHSSEGPKSCAAWEAPQEDL